MITFTIPSFISYTIFIIVWSLLLFILLRYLIDDIKSNKKIPKEEKVKSGLKIGGIYGKVNTTKDKNNPFCPIRRYDYFIVILDVKPSRDGRCDYCKYAFLNDDMSPYSGYSDTIIYSDITKRFENWEYIKDIDLKTIKIS